MKKNIAIIDIDGILGDYRLGLLYWIRQSCPKLSQKANSHLLKADTWINYETMGITYKEWLEVLEMFRMSGGKQSIPLFEGAKELVDSFKSAGLEIVLLTSRPIDIYSNIYRDTVEWLRINKIEHDLLLWSKNKAEMVYKMRMIEKTIVAIDDELSHVLDYSSLEILTYWVNHYHKKGAILNPYIREVSSIKEIKVEEFMLRLKEVSFE